MLQSIRQVILFIIEWCFKLTASLATAISLGSQGGFFYKVAEGFQSLPQAVRQIVWWIQNIPQISKIVDDYNTLTAATFNQKYGAGAVHYVMDYLNNFVGYFQRVYKNLVEQPVVTLLAAVVVFLIFYLVAWLTRFVRQRGQGSVVTKFERRVGNRMFKRKDRSQTDGNKFRKA